MALQLKEVFLLKVIKCKVKIYLVLKNVRIVGVF